MLYFRNMKNWRQIHPPFLEPDERKSGGVAVSELSKLERLISIRIIQEDVEAIYSLLKTERDSIFAMEVIPYYVLFVQSCQEYMEKNFLPESMEKDFKDIRNHIKAYAERFGKSQRRVLSVDDTQNEDFKKQLRFEFLKTMNIHLNLGSYWTDSGHIIGNTQQLADFLSVSSMFDPELKEKSFQIGHHIGSFVTSVRDGLSKSMEHPFIGRKQSDIKINYYYDINTNKNNELLSPSIPKEVNLFFLHLLCNMNFVKHILRPLFADGNTWIFRIEYIVSYYTLRALERYKNYCENNSYAFVDTEGIVGILAYGENLFQTKLRNCMMHYNLENAGVITSENIDKPFYGIIESCFDGMSYQNYTVSLHNLSDMIIEYLGKQFDFTGVRLKKL